MLDASDITKLDVAGGANGEDFSFDVATDYFFVKYGRYMSFFSTGGVGQTVDFAGTPGLSNYGGIGDVAPIPVPAAGLLLLTAIGGLGLMRRRQAAA